MLNDDRRVVLLTLLLQTGASLGLAGLLALWDQVAALSALLGGMTAVVPNGFLAARLLKPRAGGARGLMRSAWIGEIGKLLLTALLFGVIFAFIRPLAVPAVFGGFIGAQLVVFGALLIGGTARPSTTKS
ncbi:MAG TPA: ATP synthase subunit I [Gammaproteobacteria bacterium]